MQKEILIKKVPTPPIVFYAGALLMTGLGIEELIEKKIWKGVLLIMLGIGFFYIRKWERKKTQLIMRITEDKLWTRNRGNKTWDSILFITFRYDHNQLYMDIYGSNEVVADEEINLQGINMHFLRLRWIMKKHVLIKKSWQV